MKPNFEILLHKNQNAGQKIVKINFTFCTLQVETDGLDHKTKQFYLGRLKCKISPKIEIYGSNFEQELRVYFFCEILSK